jgi:hypothetical protein
MRSTIGRNTSEFSPRSIDVAPIIGEPFSRDEFADKATRVLRGNSKRLPA